MWLKTGFAVVIGGVGVIIEDLEEQQSSFGIIDFLTEKKKTIGKQGRNFNQPNVFGEQSIG